MRMLVPLLVLGFFINLCSGCMRISCEEAGQCPEGPFLQWATPALPLGQSLVVELIGKRFNGAPKLTVELLAQGKMVSTELAPTESEGLVVTLKLPPQVNPGMAQIRVRNEKGESQPINIRLVDLSRTKSLLTMTKETPSFLGLGLYKKKDTVFVKDGEQIDYAVLAEKELLNITKGTAALGPTDGMKENTPLIAISQSTELHRWIPKEKAEGFDSDGSAKFMLDQRLTYTRLVAGSLDPNNVLILALDSQNRLQRCTFSAKEVNKCDPVPGPVTVSSHPSSLLVGNGHVFLLDQNGILTERNGAAGLPNCTANCLTGLPAVSIVAMASGDPDQDGQTDIIAATMDQLWFLRYRNDRFVATKVTIPMPSGAKFPEVQALAITNLDGDMSPDVLLQDKTGTIHAVLLNQGPTTDSTHGSAIFPMLDRNGAALKGDLFAATPTGHIVVAQGTNLHSYN